MTDNQDIIIVDSQAPAIYQEPRTRRGFSVEAVIGSWLSAKKLKRSGSERTQEEYRRKIVLFREYLRSEHKLDLLPPDENVTQEMLADYAAAVSDAAQAFCSLRTPAYNHTSTRPGPVSQSEQAKRLAIISSFYGHVIRKQHYRGSNPIDLLDRPHVQSYAGAKALDPEDVARVLASIDTSTLAGLQEKALLCILLYTGRRAQEVAGLRLRHITAANRSQIMLHFESGKGGKQFHDVLPVEISALLLKWLESRYNGYLTALPGETPIWTALYHTSRRDAPMSYKAMAGIMYRHFGTRKIHATRHTFAHMMIKADAKIDDIQKRLGHANAATTGRYIDALEGDSNPYADKLVGLMGIKQEKGKKRNGRYSASIDGRA